MTDTTAAHAAPGVRVPLVALLRTHVVALFFAAAATELFAALVRAAGVHLAVGDPGGDAASVVPLHPGAFAISLTMATVVGAGLAAAINRWSSRPARVYTVVAAALVAASLAAPLTAAATSAGTKWTLVVAHVIAAAIVIPLVRRRLGGVTGE